MSAPSTYRLALSAGADFRMGSQLLDRRHRAAVEEERQRVLRELRPATPPPIDKQKAA